MIFCLRKRRRNAARGQAQPRISRETYEKQDISRDESRKALAIPSWKSELGGESSRAELDGTSERTRTELEAARSPTELEGGLVKNTRVEGTEQMDVPAKEMHEHGVE